MERVPEVRLKNNVSCSLQILNPLYFYESHPEFPFSVFPGSNYFSQSKRSDPQLISAVSCKQHGAHHDTKVSLSLWKVSETQALTVVWFKCLVKVKHQKASSECQNGLGHKCLCLEDTQILCLQTKVMIQTSFQEKTIHQQTLQAHHIRVSFNLSYSVSKWRKPVRSDWGLKVAYY